MWQRVLVLLLHSSGFYASAATGVVAKPRPVSFGFAEDAFGGILIVFNTLTDDPDHELDR